MNKLSIVIHCHRDMEYKYQKILAAILNKKITIKEASIEAGVSPNNIHRMINKLQNAGYIKKTFGGRNVYISITEKGIRILKEHGGEYAV